MAWSKLYPQFGTVGALDLVKCLNWPSGSTPTDPKDLKIPVLLLGVQNDPIVGNEGVAAVAATIINAGAANRRVIWQGVGHGASIYSSCAHAARARLPGQRQPARHRHVLPRLARRPRTPVYGALVAVPESLLSAFRPRTSAPSAATVLRSVLWPVAIISVIHRGYVLGTNGYITDDFGPVYRAVINFRRGLDIYNEHFDQVDPHYLYPPGGTLLLSPFGFLPIDASRYWFITINTIAIVLAAYFLLRLFKYSLSSVAAPALLLAMFCTESVTNTLVFTNINGCILLCEVLFFRWLLDGKVNHQWLAGRRDRPDAGDQAVAGAPAVAAVAEPAVACAGARVRRAAAVQRGRPGRWSATRWTSSAARVPYIFSTSATTSTARSRATASTTGCRCG